MADDSFELGGKKFKSRLIVGTGKYRDFAETKAAVEESGAEIVTVAVRRVNITDRGKENLLDYLDPKRYQILPNTAGCFTAEEAIRTCRLAREVGVGELVKLEVIGDQQTLFPDVAATLEAARVLVKEGFKVMPYVTDDPVTCLRLQEIGCVAVMPLAAPIGSGLGIRNPFNLRDHYRAGEGAGDRRCGRRHGVRCGGGDGTRMRRRADEYCDRGREGSDCDGACDEACGGGGQARVSRGANRAQAVCDGVESVDGADRVAGARHRENLHRPLAPTPCKQLTIPPGESYDVHAA